MSGKSRYDEYIPLLSNNENDHRVRLLLHELQDIADTKRIAVNRTNYIPSDLEITDKDLQRAAFLSQFFTNKSYNNYGHLKVHIEWVALFMDIGEKANSGPTTTGKGNEKVLDIIKNLGGIAERGSLKELMQFVVKKIMQEIKDNSSPTPADIKDKHDQWANASTFTYNAKLYLDLLEGCSTSSNAHTKSCKIISDLVTDYKNYVGTYQNKTNFSYNYDKYVRSVLEEAVVKPISLPSTSFFAESVEEPVQKYYRKLDGKLYTMVNDVETEISVGSKYYEENLKADNKCFTTGIKHTSADECANYLKGCLAGKNIDKCKTYLQNPNFWVNAEEEVKNMLPAMVVQTLKAFQFDIVSERDEVAKRNLQQFVSVEKWLEKLNGMIDKTIPAPTTAPSGKLLDKEYKDIAGNEKLIGYLRMLVQKTRENPGILNTDYAGKVEASEMNRPDIFKGTRLFKMGLRPFYATSSSVAGIERLGQAIKDHQLQLRLDLGVPGQIGFRVPFLLSGLTGGANVHEDLEKNMKNMKTTHQILGNYYQAMVQRLAQHGKKIQEDDDKQVKELLTKLKDAEIKLNKAIIYADKYSVLLEVHGERDDTSTLSFDHLKQFVEARNKYFARVSKKQNDLVSIIRTIADAVAKETTDVLKAKMTK
jgi:hypothetical protein